MKNQFEMSDSQVFVILNKGNRCIVSLSDFDLIKGIRWHSSVGTGKTTYARGSFNGNKVYMHRLIIGLSSITVDHIDGNGLNNTRENLRSVTHRENTLNSSVRVGRKYKGPVKSKNGNYKSYIKINYKTKYLGTFPTEKDAAIAYNKAALTYFGEFAKLNDIPEQETNI